MLRQYELVEKVKGYDPDADEALINRAYVFSMKAHGSQTRASGDPYYSHPIEVAGILTDLHLDDETIVTAILHDTIEDTLATTGADQEAFRQERRPAGRRRHQALQDRGAEREPARGGESAQVPARHDGRHPRPAGQARRPAAQHAHAPFHQERGEAPPHRPRDDGHLRAARRADRHVRVHDARCRLLAFGSSSPTPTRSITRRLDADPQGRRRRPRPRIGRGIKRRISRPMASRPRCRAARSIPIRSGARWPSATSASSSSPTSWPSAPSSDSVEDCYRALGLIHQRWHDRAGPVQGLHLDAQAQRLPLAPHHA